LGHAGGEAAEGEALLRRVESLAEAHRGYAQLFRISEFTGDRERLFEHMTALAGSLAPGPNQSCAAYVFDRFGVRAPIPPTVASHGCTEQEAHR
jgi:hypothetical protein